MMRYPDSHEHPVAMPQQFAGATTSLPLSNDQLAVQLQQNWLAKNPMMEHLISGTKDTLDDSLTSLNWLHSMNINIGEATPPISPRPVMGGTEAMRVNPNQVLATNLKQSQWQLMDIQPSNLDQAVNYEQIDYKTNPYIKPPYR